MSVDPSDDPRAVAVEQLEAFGMSAYAARTFVTLMELGHGTAREVSEASEVPRTRVYDAVEELHDRGLVDVKHVSPKEFLVVSVETARRTFERETNYRIDALAAALRELQPVERQENREGVWSVDGAGAVRDRLVDLFATAQDDIFYTTSEESLPEEIVAELSAAAERGVSVRFAGGCSTLENQIQQLAPGVEVVTANGLASAVPSGRFILVDGEKTLVSVPNANGTGHSSQHDGEVAVWGEGTKNNLVVVLKSIIDGDPQAEGSD